jgi:hemerythrin-like domain-containing protein
MTQPDEIDKILDKTFVYGVGTTSDDIRGNDTAYINLKNHAIKEAHQAIATMIKTEVNKSLEDVRKWVEYNKHDMGEMGEFIRTKYVYNKLEELSKPRDGGAE